MVFQWVFRASGSSFWINSCNAFNPQLATKRSSSSSSLRIFAVGMLQVIVVVVIVVATAVVGY